MFLPSVIENVLRKVNSDGKGLLQALSNTSQKNDIIVLSNGMAEFQQLQNVQVKRL